MGISIIIYRLSDIYLNQIRIRLFGTISDLLNTIEFRAVTAIWIRLDQCKGCAILRLIQISDIDRQKNLLAARNSWRI